MPQLWLPRELRTFGSLKLGKRGVALKTAGAIRSTSSLLMAKTSNQSVSSKESGICHKRYFNSNYQQRDFDNFREALVLNSKGRINETITHPELARLVFDFATYQCQRLPGSFHQRRWQCPEGTNHWIDTPSMAGPQADV